MRKFKIILLCCLAICVAGCTRIRESIDANYFNEIMSNRGYKTIDSTGSYDYATSAYRVENGDIKLFFIKGDKKYNVEGLYIDECRNVFNAIGSLEYDQKVLSGDNWTSLKITTEDKFYYVSWIDDTYLYIETPLKEQNKMEEIVKELGY